MKKLFAIITVVAMMLSMSVIANADQSASIEYDGNKAVITISTTAFETFDVGVVSDLTPTIAIHMDYLMGVKGNAALTYSDVMNPAATDAAGNAYGVITGAGCDAATGAPVDYEGAMYTFTYEGVEEGTEFLVVSGTAAVDDVTTATEIAKLVAATEEETTPEPTDEPTPEPTKVPDPTDEPDPVDPTDKPEPTEPSDNGGSKAPATFDATDMTAMITLAVVAGLAIVVLKKRATN